MHPTRGAPADLDWADHPERRRWEVRDGDEVVAYAEYRLSVGRITFTHTVVDLEYEGRGIGTGLARMVLDDAVARGLRITPRCPFIRGYLGRHTEYADWVDVPEPR